MNQWCDVSKRKSCEEEEDEINPDTLELLVY